MNTEYEIRSAFYLYDYKIKLTFKNNRSGVVDLSDHAHSNNVFRKFLDKNYFRNFRIAHGTLIWGKGELDIAPEYLFYLSFRSEPDLQIQFRQWGYIGRDGLEK